MFDRMIISDVSQASPRGRSRYFIISGLVIGVLFVSAVVLSIYAVDLDLGNENFDLSVMLAPVAPTEPEPPRETPPNPDRQAQQNDGPVRIVNMQRPDEQPLSPSSEISVERNRYVSRPLGAFEIGKFDSVGPNLPVGAGDRTVSSDATGSSVATTDRALATKSIPPPPPALTKPRVPPVVSKGVVTGMAKSLPHPPYPPAARAMGVEGPVSVQVMIDEEGNVISAKAVSGHPMLRKASETAASAAKFGPTLLSGIPVKVTGVIVYNFTR